MLKKNTTRPIMLVDILVEGPDMKLPNIKYMLNNRAIRDNTKAKISAKDFLVLIAYLVFYILIDFQTSNCLYFVTLNTALSRGNANTSAVPSSSE